MLFSVKKENQNQTSNSKENKKSKGKSKKETDSVELKVINKIFAQAEKSGLAFYKTAQRFSNLDSSITKLSSPEKQFALYKNRVKKLVKLHNSKMPKAPKDLQKALIKADLNDFALLMLGSNPKLGLALQSWAISAEYAENGLANKWNLGRKINQYLNADSKGFLRKNLLLASYSSSQNLPKDEKKQAYKIVELLVQSPYAYQLSGANTFDNIRWFNKEIIEDSLNTIILFMKLNAKDSKIEAINKLYKDLLAAKLKAAYKCDLFLKEFAQKENKKTAKKTGKKITAKGKLKGAKTSETKKKSVKVSKKPNDKKDKSK